MTPIQKGLLVFLLVSVCLILVYLRGLARISKEEVGLREESPKVKLPDVEVVAAAAYLQFYYCVQVLQGSTTTTERIYGLSWDAIEDNLRLTVRQSPGGHLYPVGIFTEQGKKLRDIGDIILLENEEDVLNKFPLWEAHVCKDPDVMRLMKRHRQPVVSTPSDAANIIASDVYLTAAILASKKIEPLRDACRQHLVDYKNFNFFVEHWFGTPVTTWMFSIPDTTFIYLFMSEICLTEDISILTTKD